MLIGLTGKIGCGKDTVAELIVQLQPERGWKIKKYADKLKKMAYLLSGWEDQYSQEGKMHYLPDWGMTVREMQQKLGTEAIRYHLHPHAWVLALFADYHPEDCWIISDIRFPDELEAVINKGGKVFRVVRPDNPFLVSEHTSETALDEVNLPVIKNTGTIEELKNKIEALLAEQGV